MDATGFVAQAAGHYAQAERLALAPERNDGRQRQFGFAPLRPQRGPTLQA